MQINWFIQVCKCTLRMTRFVFFFIYHAAIIFYFILHLCFCWFCYVVTLFWHIMCPFHARTCKINGRNKFLYIAVLIFSLVLPTTPIIAGFATGGFSLRQFPPTVCVTKSGALLYYTVILPLSVKTGIGTSLLIIIFAELIKVTKTLLPAYLYLHNIAYLFAATRYQRTKYASKRWNQRRHHS